MPEGEGTGDGEGNGEVVMKEGATLRRNCSDEARTRNSGLRRPTWPRF
jgi:hypothetical protein